MANSSTPSPRSNLSVGVSTLAALTAASGAHATIIDFNTPITSDDSTPGDVFWDVDGTGGNEVRFNNYIGAFNFKDIKFAGNGFSWVINATGDDNLQGLGSSVSVSVNPFRNYVVTVFISGNIHKSSDITSGVPTYAGFQFNPTGGMVLYGWANITLTTGGVGTFTINSWAYEDNGNTILTGATAVPEPSTYALGLGMLALGAAGLRRFRKARAVAV